MGVRVGVDVGGTFTKAVAFDLEHEVVAAQAVVPTTHTGEHGVATGVVEVVAAIADQVGAANIDLVVHSTTQAVNALIEGDTEPIGVIGLGRRPELSRARKRTELRGIEVAPGRNLQTIPVFFDVTDGLDEAAVIQSLEQLKAEGAATVCVAEAFAPDDASNEARVAELAASVGLPSCTSAELSGLYGLELRAITAALNASVLPIAAATAGYVEQGLAESGIDAPLMIMRGDGGATDMNGFRLHPVRTLYSGPAASVAGALRFADARDAVVVEVGGTSTNVAAIRNGHPALSYVQVGRHATALRSVDVRVIGAAGGSMLRVRRRRVYGVGPRSAHIAGLKYASFAPPGTFAAGGRAVEFAPNSDDPSDYLAIETPDGSRWAITNTCAAVACGITEPGDYAYADPAEALSAFGIVGSYLKLDGETVARRMLEASGTAICDLIAAVAEDVKVEFPPPVVAVGGGAGGLGRFVASMLATSCTVPDRAEVISSIGDALSLLRAEREQTADRSDAALISRLVDEVEREITVAGASPTSIEVRVDEQPEKGTVRAVATGSVALATGARPGREPISITDAADIAKNLGAKADPIAVGSFWLAVAGSTKPRRPASVFAFDRWGDPVVEVAGEMLLDPPPDAIASAVERLTRYRGPMTVEPTVWVLTGNHVTTIESGDRVATASSLAENSQRRVTPGAVGDQDMSIRVGVAVIVGSN